MRMLILAAAACAAVAAPAVAQSARSTLTLASATGPATATIIDGASWRCEGSECVATGGQNQPAARACRRVVQRLGAVSAFTYRGVTLSAEQIAACNA